MFPTARLFLSTLVISLFFYTSNAQLNVEFAMDRTEGCSPLKVDFTNMTSGASSSATYSWDFGNGNKSALQNPGAVFVEEKTYTVTLTITDAGKSSSKSKTITVSKKPQVDFSASLTQGCSPQPVTFTGNATADNGSISEYAWDFGDGFTSKSYSSQTNHTFLIPQKATIILSVTDNHGCTNSQVMKDMINILPGVTADFEPDKTFVCFTSDPITMTNNSTCTRPLTYTWDFGDGTTSTQTNPAHTFNKKGIYTVQLVAKSDEGCSATLNKPALVNVGEFQSSISAPDTVCQGMMFNISNTSSPTPTSTLWVIDGYSYPYYMKDNPQILSSPGEHTVQINNSFGSCQQSVSKKIIVRPLPQPKGFLVDIPPYCTFPAIANFTDTNSISVRSDWNFGYYNFATGKTASYGFTYSNSWPVTLTITDIHGCQNSVQQIVPIETAEVIIQSTDNNGSIGCLTLTKSFSASSNVELTSYNWDFGDGTSSADATPQHTFGVGEFKVVLHYKSKNGCTGDAGTIYVNVASKPVADFTSNSASKTVCGPTPYTLVANTRGITSEWYVNGVEWDMDQGIFTPVFPDTGKYTIMLIQRAGTCSDTIVRKDYVTVLPSYPQVTFIQNTCEGDHGTVTINQDSKYAESGTWDFGDGQTAPFNPDQAQITHHFSKSGEYVVRLTTKSGSCENTTSGNALILIKRHAVFSASQTDICAEAGLNFTISNLDLQTFSRYSDVFYLKGFLFRDGTFVPPDYNYYYSNYITSMPYAGTQKTLPRINDSISVITMNPFGCYDTSNYIPLKLEGAQAAFQIVNDDVCFKSPVVFNDTSKAQNTSIISRTWTFGDGQSLVTTSGGQVTHIYNDPSSYDVTLKVKDAGGCTSTTSSYTHQITVRGPKASFSIYAPLHIDVPYFIYNNTNNYGSNSTSYSWDFGDGTTSTSVFPEHTWSKPGNYNIRLIAKNNETDCADTSTQSVTVLLFNAHFSTTTSYINNQDCSPVLAQFTNTSNDYSGVKWDFGDGTYSVDNNYPSHLYTQPGKYVVTLTVTGNNGLEKSYTDSVLVIKKTATFSADILRTCTSNAVTLSGIADASSYLWDFGDGSLAEASDSFSVHYYKDAGSYIPSLVVKDDNGCEASVILKNSIAVDSLSVSLAGVPSNICTPKQITFVPQVYKSPSGDALIYHWDFGTGNKKDTSNAETPSFNYADPGSYPVTLKIVSAAGCTKEAVANILALKGLGGKIDGPSDICQKATAQFIGSTLVNGSPQWNWIFDDGSTSNSQTPPAKTYNSPGNFSIRLVVDNNGCSDTVTKILQVHETPQLTTSLDEATICQGASVNLSVDGATTYSWTPIAGLQSSVSGAMKASPIDNTTYVITGSSSFGCSNSTQVQINVIHPFTIQSPGDVFICKGKSVQLSITGGASFQWINNTAGLSSINTSNPTAAPETTMIYTVVASGDQQCFSDTAHIKVTVLPTPVADAGSSIQVFAGTTGQLHASGSPDIVQWEWTPSKYLDCNNCASPNVTPLEPVNYTLTVSTADGCTTTDTVSVKLLCGKSQIFIPNAFTPNHDGLNDVFRIRGQGITRIDHFQIYDRWGELVFECSNLPMDDKNAAWDGLYKGQPAPAGSYVYIVQMSCSNQSFTRRGSVTVIY